MAYLVTGGTGYLGSYVVRDLLQAGKEVVCLQRSGINPVFRSVVGEDNLDKARIVQADISNTFQVFDVIRQNKIDAIIHLSSLLGASGSSSSETQPAYALQVNGVGMSNLFEAMRLFGIRKMVWTSTGQIFGRLSEIFSGTIGDDNAVYMPDTWYSATKALCESMSRVYFSKFGIDSLGLRTGMILGIGKVHGKSNILNQFFMDAATNHSAVMMTSDANQVRTLNYVENVSDLILKACESPAAKTRNFNAVDYLVSCNQPVEAMRRVNPQAQLSIKNNVRKEEQTWGGSTEPEIDISGLRKELNWEPKYSLEESLARIFNHFRRQEGMPLIILYLKEVFIIFHNGK
jgi:nucleoside-diphosphate-sugar epimerase